METVKRGLPGKKRVIVMVFRFIQTVKLEHPTYLKDFPALSNNDISRKSQYCWIGAFLERIMRHHQCRTMVMEHSL